MNLSEAFHQIGVIVVVLNAYSCCIAIKTVCVQLWLKIKFMSQ